MPRCWVGVQRLDGDVARSMALVCRRPWKIHGDEILGMFEVDYNNC